MQRQQLGGLEVSVVGAWDLAQVAIEREIAVLQAAWRDASSTAPRRFLQNLGISLHALAGDGTPLVAE